MPSVAGWTGTRPTVCTGAPSDVSFSNSVTQNSPRRLSLPWSSTAAPSPSWRAIQGWLNHTATAGPLSSNTRASTRLRRRSRMGLTVTERTATATVASSPSASWPIRRTSRRSR